MLLISDEGQELSRLQPLLSSQLQRCRKITLKHQQREREWEREREGERNGVREGKRGSEERGRES